MSSVPAVIAEVKAQGSMNYADVIALFPRTPSNVEMKQLREALDFRLVANESGGLDHIVSAKQGGNS